MLDDLIGVYEVERGVRKRQLVVKFAATASMPLCSASCLACSTTSTPAAR